MNKKNFSYDEITDSLFISRKKQGEIVQGSAEIGNLIIDFSIDGRIVSIEFLKISSVLDMVNLTPQIFNELKNIELKIQRNKTNIVIFASLITPTIKQVIPLANVPLKNPLLSV